MASVGVICQLNHPILKDALAKSVTAWMRAYDKYKTDVDAINRQHSEEEEISALPLVACIEPSLLSGFVAMGVFAERTTVSEVTSDDIRTWIGEAAVVDDVDIAATVKAALVPVKMRPQQGDARGYVTTFFVDVHTALSDARVAQVYTNAEKPLILALVDKLEPPMLRSSIRQSIRFWPSDDRYEMKKFQEHVLTAAQSVMTVSRVVGPDRPRPEREPNKDSPKPTKQERRNAKRLANKRKLEDGAKKDETDAWTKPCLNVEVCDGIHRVRDCPITSKEKADELLAARRKKRQKSVNKFEIGGTQHLDGTDWRYETTLEGLVTLPVLGDGGSDVTMFAGSVLDQLINKGAKLDVRTIEPPLLIYGAAYDNDKPRVAYTADKECSFDLVMKLPCGRMRLRQVPSYIIREEMDEGIFSRPLLEALEFSLNNHLKSVRLKFDNANITELLQERKNTHVKAGPSSLCMNANPPYLGIRFEDHEPDPVLSTPSASDLLRQPSRVQIDDAFDKMIARSKSNGMSAHGLEEARAILERYRDVFRINIEADETAKVEPLRVRLKPNARPTRAVQRRYPPAQRAFIITKIREL